MDHHGPLRKVWFPLFYYKGREIKSSTGGAMNPLPLHIIHNSFHINTLRFKEL
jgi:hypothetical protein